jgi:hypothetical protein
LLLGVSRDKQVRSDTPSGDSAMLIESQSGPLDGVFDRLYRAHAKACERHTFIACGSPTPRTSRPGAPECPCELAQRTIEIVDEVDRV